MLTIIGSLSLSSAPIASASEINDTMWTEKYAETNATEETSFEPYVAKEEILAKDIYWVVAILDGDTIMVSGADRNVFQVRLLAVDTNEVNGPDSTAECYGQEASLFTTKFLKNRAVHLLEDPANQDEDPFGRKLRYVYALQNNGEFESLNEALLQNGYATFPEEYPVTDPNKFTALEQNAQIEGKGLFGACE